jgi:hypothetical protein
MTSCLRLYNFSPRGARSILQKRERPILICKENSNL